MKKLILILSFILIVFNVNSQINDFSLKGFYSYDDIKNKIDFIINDDNGINKYYDYEEKNSFFLFVLLNKRNELKDILLFTFEKRHYYHEYPTLIDHNKTIQNNKTSYKYGLPVNFDKKRILTSVIKDNGNYLFHMNDKSIITITVDKKNKNKEFYYIKFNDTLGGSYVATVTSK